MAAGLTAAVVPEGAGGRAFGGGSTHEADPGVGALGREGVIGVCAHGAAPTVNIASNTDPPKPRFIAILAPETL